MASSQYSPEYPNGNNFEEKYRDFISDFYQISDTPESHEEYSHQYNEDASLTMGSRSVKGRRAILDFRKAMWEHVKSRSHHPKKVFTTGSGSSEIMLYGTVEYTFKDGRKGGLDWAARGTLDVGEDGKVRWAHYQDSAATK